MPKGPNCSLFQQTVHWFSLAKCPVELQAHLHVRFVLNLCIRHFILGAIFYFGLYILTHRFWITSCCNLYCYHFTWWENIFCTKSANGQGTKHFKAKLIYVKFPEWSFDAKNILGRLSFARTSRLVDAQIFLRIYKKIPFLFNFFLPPICKCIIGILNNGVHVINLPCAWSTKHVKTISRQFTCEFGKWHSVASVFPGENLTIDFLVKGFHVGTVNL